MEPEGLLGAISLELLSPGLGQPGEELNVWDQHYPACGELNVALR